MIGARRPSFKQLLLLAKCGSLKCFSIYRQMRNAYKGKWQLHVTNILKDIRSWLCLMQVYMQL